MNPLPRRDVETGLMRKGFELDNRNHEYYYYRTIGGNKTHIWTKISRGTSHREISRENLDKMKKRLKLSPNDFIDLIRCPLSREDYEEKMRAEDNIRTA